MTEIQIALLVKDNERLIQLLDIVLLRNNQLEQQIRQLSGTGDRAITSFCSYPTVGDMTKTSFCSHPQVGDIPKTSFSTYPKVDDVTNTSFCSDPNVRDRTEMNICPTPQNGIGGKTFLCPCPEVGDVIRQNNDGIPGNGTATNTSFYTSPFAGAQAIIKKNEGQSNEAMATPYFSLPRTLSADASIKNNNTPATSQPIKEINQYRVQDLLHNVMPRANYDCLDHTADMLILLYRSPRQSMKDLQKLTGLSASGITKRIMSMKKVGLITRMKGKGLLVTEKSIRLLDEARV